MTATVSVFSPNAQTVMCKRYYLRGARFTTPCNNCNDTHETEDEFFDRVSMGRVDYREMLTSLDFLPNSPTLMNIGNSDFDGTLSACFKFDPLDQMFDDPSAIMPTLMKAAAVLKAGGGVGYALSQLRPKGTLVKSTHGEAFGPEGFLRMAHVLAAQITQGGKRDAAQMGILHVDHPDIRSFIHLKDNDRESFSTFNISVAMTDLFMERAVVGNAAMENEMLDEIAQSAWKTGDPGLYFIDESERHNPTPWLGQLTGTNPCGEVPLLDNEPCNLGSLNLGHFVFYGAVDWVRLTERTELAIEYLDDVLDRNTFPSPEITEIAMKTRKLGLGVCGWADMLAQLGIEYDSTEAVDLGRDIMAAIELDANRASIRLGGIRGHAPAFDRLHSVLMHRNATVTCIAPTGTIAIIMNASSGIEPYFAEENIREMGDGTKMTEKAWASLTLPDDHRPKVSHDIHWQWHIRHQAAFQRSTDLAVSKTINMPEHVTWQDIRAAYVFAWEHKCKGITIYRDKSLGAQVLTTIAHNEELPVQRGSRNGDTWRDVLPDRRPAGGKTQKFRVGETEGFLTVNPFEDGQPAEVFVKLSRAGSTLDGFADWWAQTFSVALQMAHKQGVPFTQFTSKFKGRKFEPSGLTGDARLPHATSIADYIAKWMELEFGGPVEQAVAAADAAVCPDCNNLSLQMVEGCEVCRTCGWSAC